MADDLTYNIQGLITEFTCGFCNSQVGYEIEFAKACRRYNTWGDFLGGRVIAVLKCRKCGMLNTFIFRLIEEDFETSFQGDKGDLSLYMIENPNMLYAGYDEFEHTINPTWIEIIGQYPYGHKISNTVPDTLQQDLQEAGNCLAVNAPNAAVIMCRRVVQKLVTYLRTKPDKFSHKKMLGIALQELEDEGNVDPLTFKALCEIKEWGNLSPHLPNDETEINLEEAKKIVEFVFYIVDRVFPRRDIEKMSEELEKRRKHRKNT